MERNKASDKKSSFRDLLKEKEISCAQLSKMSDIPYMTISDLKNEKSDFKSIKVETALKIAGSINMTIEEIYNYVYRS